MLKNNLFHWIFGQEKLQPAGGSKDDNIWKSFLHLTLQEFHMASSKHERLKKNPSRFYVVITKLTR